MIEVVLGQVKGTAVADEVLGFWASQSALSSDEAQRRLPEVICVLRDHDGRVGGVSSAFAADVPLIGNRRFWVYRNLLRSDLEEETEGLLRTTFHALEDRFDGSSGTPIGLVLVLASAGDRRRWPEVEWQDPPMLYAGYTADDQQVRVAYFAEADIA